MKKIYTLVAAIAVAGTITAQTTIDFENHPLAGPETHDNGNDGPGTFDFNGVEFEYLYNLAGNYFSGFAISNETDVTTPGFMNQYSAYPGSGANGSSNFAIFYSFPNRGIKTTTANQRIESFELTNTTYAYLSMRDGDGYGKQFGSNVNFLGVDDGTNGEDYFFVRIYAENYAQTEMDSIDFYLGDYRFADSTQDYIIDSWNTIDLTGLSFDVATLTFGFFSSDNDSQFGLRTPAYIAIDNVRTETTGGLTQLAQDYAAYPNPVQDILTIKGGNGQIRITDVLGQVVLGMTHNELSEINVQEFISGAYFITLIDDFGTRTKQFIK
jgi:hypothetical protein